jgi:hypothetical protein
MSAPPKNKKIEKDWAHTYKQVTPPGFSDADREPNFWGLGGQERGRGPVRFTLDTLIIP